ncbi:MAG: preprotein translocase subunit YajC [Planctomycetes bacterium]|nr:preprotein translocase subunit YajC [Planctomycetota bacterium]
MSMLVHWSWAVSTIVGQTTPPAGPPGGASNTAASFFPIAMMVALVAFMLLTARSQKKREKRERDELHARLSKNDRVLTSGGMMGTVMSVKENEIVLKVDETTNTKITFLKTSIQRILED